MATQKVVVEGSSVTASQLKDLFRQIEDKSLTGYHIQNLLDHRNPFEISMDTAQQLKRWSVLLAENFGIEIDIATLIIPEREPGFDRLIVVPKGLTLNRIIEVFRKKFQVYLYTEDLDTSVTVDDRVNSGAYAIWVRERVEADEENMNLSANDCKEKGVKGQTLFERLLQELAHFAETGEHLDVENVTSCTGSRDLGGVVPGVNWRKDRQELYICWDHPDRRRPRLRSRTVVA